MCLYTAARLRRSTTAAQPVAAARTFVLDGMAVRAASRPEIVRAVYPYSVIPGGAWSRAELVGALGRDPVAAAHYRGFRAETAHVEWMPEARAAYVSFRKDGRIYWTRHTVTLAAGEAVLSDGESLARARCGNRISFTPQQPAGPEVDLETPQPAPRGVTEGDAVQPPDVFHLPMLAHDVFPPMPLQAAALAAAGPGGFAGGTPAWAGGFSGISPTPSAGGAAPSPQAPVMPSPGGPPLPDVSPAGEVTPRTPLAPPAFSEGTPLPGVPALPGSPTPVIYPALTTVTASVGRAPQAGGLLTAGGIAPVPTGKRPQGGTPTLIPVDGTSGGGTTPGGEGGTPGTPIVPGPFTVTPPPPVSDTPEPSVIWLVIAGAGVLAIRRAMR
ncbi:MAG: hypothetical protein KGN36_12930 [Acidobacteriota bacterium]|nr:hypothetical protein [Acidobacteriota bacterium]